MRTTSEDYREDLLIALRMRDVPGDRIGEVLAEVDSHTAETGEDPVEAFGSPQHYAREAAGALGRRHGVWHLDGRTAGAVLVIAVLSGASTSLLTGGVLGLVDHGAGAAWGLPPLAAALAGAALAAASIAVLTATTWHRTVPVTDPRTGSSLSRPPRWAIPVVFVGLYALLVVAVLLAS